MLFAAGVKFVAGKSKATGEPFEMCTLYGLFQIERVRNDKVVVQGYGLEPGEMRVDPACIDQFKDLVWPCMIEVRKESSLFRGEVSDVIVALVPSDGVKKVKAA